MKTIIILHIGIDEKFRFKNTFKSNWGKNVCLLLLIDASIFSGRIFKKLVTLVT